MERELQQWQYQQQQPQQQLLCPAGPPALPIQPSCFEQIARDIYIREIMESIQRLQKTKEKHDKRTEI